MASAVLLDGPAQSDRLSSFQDIILRKNGQLRAGPPASPAASTALAPLLFQALKRPSGVSVRHRRNVYFRVKVG